MSRAEDNIDDHEQRLRKAEAFNVKQGVISALIAAVAASVFSVALAYALMSGG